MVFGLISLLLKLLCGRCKLVCLLILITAMFFAFIVAEKAVCLLQSRGLLLMVRLIHLTHNLSLSLCRAFLLIHNNRLLDGILNCRNQSNRILFECSKQISTFEEKSDLRIVIVIFFNVLITFIYYNSILCFHQSLMRFLRLKCALKVLTPLISNGYSLIFHSLSHLFEHLIVVIHGFLAAFVRIPYF